MPSLSFARARSLLAALLLVVAFVPALVTLQPGRAHASSFGDAVVAEAARHYGAPYAWGAVGPATFDCSGFTGYVYRQLGVSLPRTAQQQYDAIPHLAPDQKTPGDLIFMYNSSGIYHVGIYAGDNTFWAATHTGDIVRQQPIWTTAFLVGRPVGPAAAQVSAIGAHWNALGGLAGLGAPLTGEIQTPNRAGVYTHYSNGGSIYWTPATGAQAVYGAIRGTWSQLGWENGPLGFPTTDETGTPDGRGRFNHFNGGAGAGSSASIYWTPQTGAHEVHGSIRGLWQGLGWENGPMGYPVTNETGTPDGIGRFNHFDGRGAGASIYWTPQLGAHSVQGAIRAAWARSGWELGPLGYPVSNEHPMPGGMLQSDFAHGVITFNTANGAIATHLR